MLCETLLRLTSTDADVGNRSPTDAIVAMVDAKLRDPQQLTLGSDGLQRLFGVSGLLTGETMRDFLS